jgi:N-acetylglucosamine-6-sulfatase
MYRRHVQTRRRFLKALGIGAATLATSRWSMAAKAGDEAKRPNILFIMSDDHCAQAIGAYGGRLAPLNPTPVIDTLANEGMRLDRVFCHNSICTPSRANILTGQYSRTNGILDLGGVLPPEKHHLPREMKKAGYHTAMVAKWHLKAEPAEFDYYCVLPGQGKYFDPDFRIRGEKDWPDNTIRKMGQHSSDAVTELSIEWLKTGWDRDKPFFLMHHFKAPHDMFENARRYDDYLEDVEIPEPANLRDVPAGSVATKGYGSGLTKGHENWKLGRGLGIDQDLPEPRYSSAVYQKYLKRYLRCVKGVDDNVKRLLDHLKQIGELDNTVILYTGDQGFLLGEHDLMDKRWIFEESMRMPLLIRWPGKVKAGSTNGWLINNTDFAPTMLEIAGVSTPDYMQGRSFVGALKGEPKPDDWRDVTYYRYWMHMAHNLRVPAHFGVRSERYKLVFYYGLDNRTGRRAKKPTPVAWEFYDLQKDPTEMKNEYANPAYAEIIAEMKAKLKHVREELNETDEKYPHIQKVIDEHWD